MKKAMHKMAVLILWKLIIFTSSIVLLAIAMQRVEYLSGIANILILTGVIIAACLLITMYITQQIRQITQQSAIELSKKSIAVCAETTLSLLMLSAVLERNAATLYKYAILVEKHMAESYNKT